MKKILPILFLLAQFLIGCSGSAPAGTSSIGTNCDSLQPTAGDIGYALNFGSKLFVDSVWQRSYTVRELDAVVSWNHRSFSALSDVSVLLFCNDNGTGDVELFYNTNTVHDNFANYDESTITNSCTKDGLMLYELDAVEEELNYKIRMWIQPLSKTRLLSVVLVFPVEESALFEKYSQELFPDLPVCK